VASNFPTSLDNFTNPSSGNTLDSPSHSLQHSDINDAVEALEAKLGIGASPAGSATSGQVLTAGTAGITTWSTLTTPGLTQIVPTSITVGGGTGSVSSGGQITLSNATSVVINGIFNSTYDSYQIIVSNAISSTGTNCYLQFTSSGTADTNAVYHWLRLAIANASVAGAAVASQAQWILGKIDTTKSQIDSTLSNPFVAGTKSYLGIGGGRTNSAMFTGDFSNSTAFDGAKLFFDSTYTVSCFINILGVKK
jgi:hypothetical protein